ncbi:MAG TPA: dTDP-glucose 4,6-dehydratase [Thermoanaerobaculia bacterium]|jgi:dTDP-glucose 4,6-dehydratase
MSRILITGGAGFIGCNFVRWVLAHREVEVVVLDKLTYAGSLENLRDVEGHERFRFVLGDVTDRDAVRRLYAEARPTAVVNFAAESHVDRSIDGPGDFIHTNIVGAFELLEAARGFLAELAEPARQAFRFLHVSTDEVYGSLGAEGLFTETTTYAPSSPYAASKAAADHLAQAYFKTYGLPVLLTNCSNNYGPYQFPEKLIPLMVLNAADGRDLPIYGDGGNVRDWIYVEDHCEGVLEVLERGRAGEKYNLGGACERTNVEVVDRICELMEAELPARENPKLRARGLDDYRQLKSYVRDRPGHDRRYAIDSSKVRRQLGWEPRHDFDSGLAATVRWYLAHRAWCEVIEAGREARRRRGLARPGSEESAADEETG